MADHLGTVVSFSSYEGRADFRRTLGALPCDPIFLQDTRHGWFQAGCETFPTFDSLLRGLRALRAERNGPLTFIGSSMGGYAALAFGNLVGADAVLAFDPQTFIDPETRAHFGDGRWAADFARMDVRLPDVSLVINSATRSLVVFGQDVNIDAVHALRLSRHPSVDVVGAEYSAHNSAREMQAELLPFMAAAISGAAARGRNLLATIDFGRWEDKSLDADAFAIFKQRLRKQSTKDSAARLATFCPEWAFARMEHGVNLASAGAVAEGIEHMQAAVELRPTYAEARLQLGIWLANRGDFTRAAEHFAVALRRAPKRAAVRYHTGLCLMELGEIGEARKHLARAVELAPAWDAAKQALNRLEGVSA